MALKQGIEAHNVHYSPSGWIYVIVDVPNNASHKNSCSAMS
jgi:hypothetical protein